jgi:hypothetical protein
VAKRPVIRTFTGKELNPLDIQPEDIDIIDIAHALSCVPRFAGHTRRPIYIAQHCVYVAKLCQYIAYPVPLKALLHDAAEAYLGDMTKWLKESPEMLPYREAERRAQDAIDTYFRVPTGGHKTIEWADRVMVRFEGRHHFGFGSSFAIDHPNYPPLTEDELLAVGDWYPWSPMKAEIEFLDLFTKLRRYTS